MQDVGKVRTQRFSPPEELWLMLSTSRLSQSRTGVGAGRSARESDGELAIFVTSSFPLITMMWWSPTACCTVCHQLPQFEVCYHAYRGRHELADAMLFVRLMTGARNF